MTTLAHIAGVPVEELAGTLAAERRRLPMVTIKAGRNDDLGTAPGDG
jgi:hypothetical protein